VWLSFIVIMIIHFLKYSFSFTSFLYCVSSSVHLTHSNRLSDVQLSSINVAMCALPHRLVLCDARRHNSKFNVFQVKYYSPHRSRSDHLSRNLNPALKLKCPTKTEKCQLRRKVQLRRTVLWHYYKQEAQQKQCRETVRQLCILL